MSIYKNYIKEINIKNEICNPYFNNSIGTKKLVTQNIYINEKNYKDLVIRFTKYVHNKSIKILRMHYNELIGRIEEREGKK